MDGKFLDSLLLSSDSLLLSSACAASFSLSVVILLPYVQDANGFYGNAEKSRRGSRLNSRQLLKVELDWRQGRRAVVDPFPAAAP